MARRLFPDVDHTRIVRNQSSRLGTRPDLIVLHTTEGTSSHENLGGWFDNPAAQASSHVHVARDGTSARYVRDEQKAWTSAYFNPRSLNIEIQGFAATSKRDWLDKYDRQLWEVARWVAHWSIREGVPIRRGFGGHRSGVVTHKSLGQLGGGHWDPGPGFPTARVLRRARKIRRERLKRRD